MPTSKSNLIHPLLRILTRVRPGSALDVGVGFGKFAFLAREYLDVRDAKSDIDRYRREKWKTRIDGVEIFKAYITELHRHLYNQIHIGDIVELLPTLPRYDLIWIGDAIEHIEKTRATELIDRLIEKSDRMFGLTTPCGDTEQEALYGDPYERHISGWTEKDFQRWPEGELFQLDDRMVLFLVSKDPEAYPIRGIRSSQVEVYRAKQFCSYWRKK